MKEMYYVFCDEIQEWSARTKEEFFENFSEENVRAYLANPRCENYDLESLRLFGVNNNSEKDKTAQPIPEVILAVPGNDKNYQAFANYFKDFVS